PNHRATPRGVGWWPDRAPPGWSGARRARADVVVGGSSSIGAVAMSPSRRHGQIRRRAPTRRRTTSAPTLCGVAEDAENVDARGPMRENAVARRPFLADGSKRDPVGAMVSGRGQDAPEPHSAAAQLPVTRRGGTSEAV